MSKIECGKYTRTPEIREKNRKGSSEGMKRWHQNHMHPRLGKTHSIETKNKMSQNRKGSKNSNWKGGITLSVRTFRKSKQYQQWRKAVLEKDNKICQNCSTTKYLEIHHILSVKNHPELKLEVNNGQILCKECHKKTDNYGHRKAI